SGLTQLTSGLPRDFAPDWSPDGTQIVFQRGRSIEHVYAIGSDGSGLRQLTHGRYDSGPAWSPDGTRIVFVRAGDLWIMRRDGRGAHNITHTRSISKDEGAPDWQPIHVANGKIQGTRFDDYLAGGPGNDVIVGGKGRD